MKKKNGGRHTLDESCEPAKNNPENRAGDDACKIRCLVYTIGIGGIIQ
jgi:hypothetical protein